MFWGLGIQFCLGLFIIRTEPGFIAFDWLGKQVQVLYEDGHFIVNQIIMMPHKKVIYTSD